MCIEGDDVLDTHSLQLLQGHRAVQTLAGHAAVLTAAVQAGHDDGHTVCLARHSLNEALEVGEVVVGRQVVLIVEQLVGHAVVAGIDHDENIVAAHRLLDQTLGIAALEAGAGALDDKAIGLVSGLSGPAHQMLVDEVGQLLGARAGDEAQVGDLRLVEAILGDNDRHNYSSLMFLLSVDKIRR